VTSLSKKPLTIILPVYNGGKYLADSLDSLFSQTFEDYELIAIDDASTDNSIEVLDSYSDSRLRVLRNNRNLGLVQTLNYGLREARGRFIARADQDDIYFPERLEKQVSFLQTHSEFSAVGSWIIEISPTNREIGRKKLPTTVEAIRLRMLTENAMAHSSVVFLADVVRELVGYNEDQLFEDWDLWSRMLAAGYKITNLPEFLMKYRKHDQTMTALCVAPTRQKELPRMISRNLKELAGIEVDKSQALLLYNARYLPASLTSETIEPAIAFCRHLLELLGEHISSKEARKELNRLNSLLYLNLASSALDCGMQAQARSLYSEMIRCGLNPVGAFARYGTTFLSNEIVVSFRKLRRVLGV
jgi:glycosyltransferase involved in cell wall biosynthesis